LPAGQPPHRGAPQASAAQRRRALTLALEGQSRLTLDTRELDRPGPSYMVDTLSALRAECGDRPLCLILGQDAFNGLPDWHRWRQLPELAHLVVISRPGVEQPADGPLADLIAARSVERSDELRARPAGAILFCTVTALGFSASGIRRQMAAGRSPRYLLPEAVLAYLQRERVYSNLD
ncbi:MAG: nicotinate-nucleotide adenylyltransferase, partial [Gammaproteobacteria bacterium]